MKLAILCSHPDSAYARHILAALTARGFRGVDVIAAAPAEPRSPAALLRAHGRRLPRAVAAALLRRLRAAGRPAAGAGAPSLAALVAAQEGEHCLVPALNGAAAGERLRARGVDLALLGGCPILRPPVLRAPRLGTLNAHMGVLPRYRGMNVLEWALLEGGEAGISVHFVDPGVDTGDIVYVEALPVLPGDTIPLLKRRAMAQQADLLSRAALAALDGPLPRRPQAAGEGRQYFAMHPALLAVAARRLQERQRERSAPAEALA
ncbi:MAG: formyltransferase family protein [Candidatus Methylomirabilales bacterium]